MSVTIGTQLGSYEITALLGKGGMGEVYRARDTKLKRDVAIKILPEEFSRDPDRVSRFQREAEVLASLNHSNIAAIHDLQEANGSRFLILELVEGETLAERIQRGPIPFDEALQIAMSICEALEAAHEKGVVHRDLKPANVKITPDGKLKVLDFGLAKAMEPVRTEGFSQSPTWLSSPSFAGVIMGTASYMSPEQAKGKNADARSDIWAFGVVLYEMLTGKPSFEGETLVEILGGVMRAEPDWSALPAAMPPMIGTLLRRCLQKDRSRRFRDIADVKISIEEALKEPSPAAVVAPARKSRERFAWLASAVLLVGVVALAIPAVVHFRETPAAAPPEIRTEINTPSTSDPASFAISPDGKRLVFAASGDGQVRLWLRLLDAVAAQPLAGTEGARYPFWSPDSRSVGFFAGSKLKRVDIAGGLPQTLANATGRGGTWSTEGVILFAPSTAGPLFRIPASGGEAVAVTKLDQQTSHRFPYFLPDGQQFLFYAQGTPETGGIYLGSLKSEETKRLTAADTAGLYAQSGWLLFVRPGGLVARRFDPSRGELTGDPVMVADSVGVDPASNNLGAFSVSAAGLVSYRARWTSRNQLTWFDRSGKALGTLGAPDENALLNPDLSPDGRRVAVDRTVQGNTDIWLLDAARTTRFTFDPSPDSNPLWSPDGSRIVFRSDRKGANNLYQKPSNGAGSEELLVESPQDKVANDWSADGRFLLYHSIDPKTGYDLWVLPMSGAREAQARQGAAPSNANPAGRSDQELAGDRKPRVFLKTAFQDRHGQFSPDGRWVAYRSDESGTFEIYVRPFPGPGGQWQVSTAGGIGPRWRPDGKELYYIAPDGRLMAVPIAVQGATLEPGTPVALFQTRIVGGGAYINRPQYDVAPDGRFLIDETIEDLTSPITLLQNWNPKN